MPRQLGEAFVRVRPDASGFGKDLGSQIGSGSEASGVEQSGSKVGSLLGKALKGAALAGVAGAGALLGVALTKGFQRLEAIDQARAKLEGLGHSAKAVNGIMTNALTAVKGTAFGLDEAATVAATSVAAGIKPGKQLEKTLRLVADAATIGGTSMADMGAIFNKVAASNKLQGDVIQQLNQQGIPIVQLLGKSLHKTSAQVLELSKQGKISFADFSKAMQEGLGGSALKSGDTFTGAWKNLMASLSRIGAGLLGGIFPHMAPAIENLTKAMGPLEDAAGKIGDKIGKVLGPALENAVPWVSHLADSLGNIDFGKVASGSSSIGQSFGKIGDALQGVDWSQVKDSFGKSAADSVNVFAVVIGFLADHLDTLAKILPAVLVGYAAFKAAQAAQNVLGIASIPIRAANTVALLASARANRELAAQLALSNGVEKVGLVTKVRSTVATVASTVASKAAAAASKVWAAGQWLLNAALTANPIGIVIAAIAGLVAGIVIAYKKSDTFRKIVQSAFKGIETAAKFMWNDVLRPVFKFILDTWLTVAGGIVHGAAKAFGWVPGIGPKLKGAADQFDRFKDQVDNALRKIPDHVDTKANLYAADAIRDIDAYTDRLRRLNNSVAKTYIRQIVTRGPVAGGGHPVPPKLATGGIVTRPTLALIGEGREPEAVVPLSKLRKMLAEGGRGGASGGRPIKVYTNDPLAAARETVRQLAFAGVGG